MMVCWAKGDGDFWQQKIKAKAMPKGTEIFGNKKIKAKAKIRHYK